MDEEEQRCGFAVVDAAGTTRWERSGSGCGIGMSAFVPAPDSIGNLLVQYSTVRYPGVTALRPTADGMNDFGSLPGDGTERHTATEPLR